MENYTPTTWANGDIIDALKLNNIEEGIANATNIQELNTISLITTTEDGEHFSSVSMTSSEIVDARESLFVWLIVNNNTNGDVLPYWYDGSSGEGESLKVIFSNGDSDSLCIDVEGNVEFL